MTWVGPYRDGKVHVLSGKCATCIFRPGNKMHLAEGRVESMVAGARRDESSITCHSTLYGAAPPAVCRGFYDTVSTTPLQLAQAMELIEFDPIPKK